MFAFAILDTHTETLWVARDGEKQLYYGSVGSGFRDWVTALALGFCYDGSELDLGHVNIEVRGANT